MGDSEVKSVALWLGKLLTEEIKYLGGVTQKVETLQRELNMLAGFLTEAVDTRRHDARVQVALSQARSLAYDCEDVIDTYILKLARHGYEQYDGGYQLGSVLRWSCILREAKTVYGIRTQIDDLNGRISTLKTDLRSYGVTAQINIDDIPGPSEAGPLRRVYTHEREERVVVGLEQDVEALVGRLMDPNDKTFIIISGMGGLGKSTLAAELYHHPKIRKSGNFQAFGWVHVSQRLQLDLVLRTILYSLVDQNDHDGRAKIDRDMKADRAHAALYEMMLRVKCVVVVDDIWNSKDWAKLEAAFPRRIANGSRVILTTRYQDILSSSASLDQDEVHLHPIKGLDGTSSWKLFQITTFPGGISTDADKEIIGRKILRHCKGVPLAIVVLGKALKRKDRVQEWKQMQENILAQIKVGGAPHKPYKEVYDVLQVSYDELPYHLKHCFLHLASFPEDMSFSANRLKHLWAAEGLLIKYPKDSCDEDEEAIGDRYMNELVSRNMVQANRIWGNGEIIGIRMHDLMRDVCIDLAKREGLFQNVNCESLVLLRDSLSPTIDKGLRRLAVYLGTEDQKLTPCTAAVDVSRAPNLRSLILFDIGKQEEQVNCTRLMEKISKDYPLLRVLDCDGIHITGKLPKKVGNLIHLRYLNLRSAYVTELSSSIKKLQSLQTLDLRVSSENLIIPNVLWKMKQLTHVYLPTARRLHNMKEKEKRIAHTDLQRYSVKGSGVLFLDGLCNLQTLLCIDLDRTDLIDLSHLKRLKNLWGTCESNKEFLRSLLQSPRINSLYIRVHVNILNEDPLALSRCQVLTNLDLYAEAYINIHLRQPLKLPNSLNVVVIWYVHLDEDPLPVLEKLPNLYILSLHMCYNGQKMACSASGFPQLKSLYFECLPYFSEWEVEQGALHKLRSLTIRECELKEVPAAIPNSANVHIQ